jgi:zinc ribbon protein
MYCDKCGAQLAPGAQFCNSCGKAVAGGPAMSAAARRPYAAGAEGRVRRHIHLLATLWLVSGVLRLIGVGWFVLFGRMFFPWMHGWTGPGWPFGPAWGWHSLGIFLAIFGALHLLLAWGLYERQPWARVLGLVLGILALLRIPFGTALGIYTLWVLAPERSAREYEQLSQSDGNVNTAGFSPTSSR